VNTAPQSPEQLRDETLARLRAELEQARRNVAGWEQQVLRVRRHGGDPAGLEAWIAAGRRTQDRLREEIRGLEATAEHERQRRARLKYGDQTVELGRRLPTTKEEE
jgi:hypothetical protein